MTATEISWRACCGGRSGETSPPLFPADRPLVAGPAVVLPARARDERDAIHEAGHVAMGLALGWRLVRATVDGAARVEWHSGCRPLAQGAVVAMAGPVAENWGSRHVVTAANSSLVAIIARVRSCCGGDCDDCQAVRACLVGARHADDAAVVARFRTLESWTIDAVRRPPIWRATRALADKLMVAGTLDGEAATAICGDFFSSGGLAAPASLEV